jgi:hypothetical protein
VRRRRRYASVLGAGNFAFLWCIARISASRSIPFSVNGHYANRCAKGQKCLKLYWDKLKSVLYDSGIELILLACILIKSVMLNRTL